MEAHKIMKLVKIFPLFKGTCFSLRHYLTLTVLNFAKEDTRYKLPLNTNYLVRRRN